MGDAGTDRVAPGLSRVTAGLSRGAALPDPDPVGSSCVGRSYAVSQQTASDMTLLELLVVALVLVVLFALVAAVLGEGELVLELALELVD